jgi:hypothetical protein
LSSSPSSTRNKKFTAKYLQMEFNDTNYKDQAYDVHFLMGMQGWFNIYQSINVTQYKNRIKDKKKIT